MEFTNRQCSSSLTPQRIDPSRLEARKVPRTPLKYELKSSFSILVSEVGGQKIMKLADFGMAKRSKP